MLDWFVQLCHVNAILFESILLEVNMWNGNNKLWKTEWKYASVVYEKRPQNVWIRLAGLSLKMGYIEKKEQKICGHLQQQKTS